MKLTVQTATADHVDVVAAYMRDLDRQELMASSGQSPRVALLESLRLSCHAWTAMADGEPIAMFGCAPMQVGSRSAGWAWLLGTDRIDDFRRDAWCLSVSVVEQMAQHYDALANYIDYRNIRSLRWLERLGFVPIEVDLEYGVERRPFILYARYSHV